MCPYIVYTMAPTGIQLFVEELFSFSLLKIFGLLLHCEGLPLWNGRQHTFSSFPLPLNLLDSCCSRTSANNNKCNGLVLSTFKCSCAEGMEGEETDTVWSWIPQILTLTHPSSQTVFNLIKKLLDNQSASLIFKKERKWGRRARSCSGKLLKKKLLWAVNNCWCYCVTQKLESTNHCAGFLVGG